MTDRYLDRARREVIPKIASSAFVVNIAPGDEVDAKVALEIGAAILLDKPILVAVPPGRTIPDRLRRIADAVVDDLDFDSDAGRQRMTAALAVLQRRVDEDDDDGREGA